MVLPGGHVGHVRDRSLFGLFAGQRLLFPRHLYLDAIYVVQRGDDLSGVLTTIEVDYRQSPGLRVGAGIEQTL